MGVERKTFDVLEAVLRHGGEISLAELAIMTGLNRTTVHRISSVLAQGGYLYQKRKGEKYSLGIKFLQYGKPNNVFTVMRDKSLPYLQNLCNEISETVNMVMLHGIETITVVSITAENRPLLVAPNPSIKFSLHCTAIGKILLASMSNSKIEMTINVLGLKAYTDNTITDINRLMDEIKEIRSCGVAYDDEERWLGIRSTAASVKDEEGDTLAALSVVGPSVRISKSKMTQIAPIVKNCALSISRSLGYVGQ